MALPKNIKKLIFFPCNNGLGHISRTTKLANYLSTYYKIEIYCDQKKLKKFKLKKKIQIKNFKLKENQVNFKKEYLKNLKKLELNSESIIITDNQIEPSLLDNKVLILANFFWHEIFKINNKLVKKIINDISKEKIPILGNYLFQNIKDNNLKKKKINFVGNFQGKFKKKKNILINLGTAEINQKIKKKLIREIDFELNQIKNKEYSFYFDKNFFGYFKKHKNIFLADHSNKMLEKIKFTIGKPGFASLTESFQNGIVFISLNLEFNDEFKFNSKTLISNKLGLVTNNFKDAIKKIHIISNDDKKYRYYLKKMKSLKWNGERDVYNFLKNYNN